jgi:multidrug efflux system membrane fusion protein
VVTGSLEVKGEPVVVIPAGALLQTGDQAAVWVVSPDKVIQRRPVKVLRFDAEAVTIESGLKAGDLVVTNGVNSLAEGQKVALPPGVVQ